MGDLAPLQSYTINIGHSLLTNCATLTKPIHEKWHSDMVVEYHICWSKVWYKLQLQKDVGFLWSVYYYVVVIYLNICYAPLIQIFLPFAKTNQMTWMRRSYTTTLRFNIHEVILFSSFIWP